MHILVTGGTGFIGSALCPQLLIDGHRLTLLARRPERARRQYDSRVEVITDLGALRDIDCVIRDGETMWSASHRVSLNGKVS